MKDGPVISVFQRLDINLMSVKTELETRVREDEIGRPIYTQQLVLNDKASNILKLAVLEARLQHTTRVEEQHLLLAILHDQTETGAKQVLEMNNMNYEDALTMFSVKNGIGLPDEDYEEEEQNDSSGSLSSGSATGKTTTTTRRRRLSSTTLAPTLHNWLRRVRWILVWVVNARYNASSKSWGVARKTTPY